MQVTETIHIFGGILWVNYFTALSAWKRVLIKNTGSEKVKNDEVCENLIKHYISVFIFMVMNKK